MADALFILIVVGFFALMVLLVRGCDRMIGPDDTSSDRAAGLAAGGTEVAETTEEVRAR